MKNFFCTICGERCDENTRHCAGPCCENGTHDWVIEPPPPSGSNERFFGNAVNHPAHYGGGDNPYEAIKVIDAWQVGFCLGNTVKYIARAGKKNSNHELQDLKKALWYLQHQIELVEKGDQTEH